MNNQIKKEIDEMPYEDMFRLWRFAPVGHPMFQGDVGEYYKKVMFDKRNQVGASEHTRISKFLG